MYFELSSSPNCLACNNMYVVYESGWTANCWHLLIMSEYLRANNLALFCDREDELSGWLPAYLIKGIALKIQTTHNAQFAAFFSIDFWG